jgi:hypothetical protein
MTESTSVLSAWESFYVIVGSSGGALIGLQFVVITLIADRRDLTTSGGLSAFATPTVVHFAGALLVSAIMSAPWPTVASLAVPVGVIGVAGLAYGVIVARRAWRQTSYEPVWQDWLWYTSLPGVAYAAIAVSAFTLQRNAHVTLFVVAASALGLLMIGIHNAWDTVTHIVVSQAAGAKTRDDSQAAE